MDALMAALVAGALTEVGDRPAWLCAILADRFRAPGAVIAGGVLALLAAAGLASIGGGLIAPKLTPEAAQLLLALALILQGGGAFGVGKPPERLDGWRLGAVATPALGLFILFFGDGLQLIVLALAARPGMPILAAAGATLGGGAILAAAALLGEAGWRRLPLLAARRGIAALFVLAGIVIGLMGLRLV